MNFMTISSTAATLKKREPAVKLGMIRLRASYNPQASLTSRLSPLDARHYHNEVHYLLSY